LTDVKLVDRDVIGFLAGCQSTGVKLVNCPAYIREWIEREAAQREDG
jgi:predicted metal-binding protein